MRHVWGIAQRADHSHVVAGFDQAMLEARCESCGAETAAEPNKLVCGECGDWHTQLVSGDEMLLVRTVGLCPPGTFVRLANGDIAVVLRRSDKANHPLVASLLDRSGSHHAQPSLYQTASGKPRIQSALARSAVSLELNHRTMVRLGLYAAQHSAGLRGLVTGPGSL